MSDSFKAQLLAHPANAAILEYFRGRATADSLNDPICLPEEIELPYLTLGTHPDLVEQL